MKNSAELQILKRSPGRPKDDTLAQRRQEEILDGATKVFAAEGYQNTDLQQVADKLGVAKGTLYRYFPSKQELFLACVDQGRKQLGLRVYASIEKSGDAFQLMEAAIRAFFQFFDENPELVELIIQERAEFREVSKHTYFFQCKDEDDDGPWEQIIATEIQSGRLRDVTVKRIMTVFSNLLYGTMFSNYFTGRHEPLEAQTEGILDVVFNGILTNKNGDPSNGS